MKKRGKTGWALPGIAASPRVSKAARVTVDQVLRIEPGERVLVVTNPEQACPHCGLPRGKGVLIENGVAVPCPVCSAKGAAA